jgi:hypothetical protein
MIIARSLTAGTAELTKDFDPYIIKEFTLQNMDETYTVTIAINETTTVDADDPIVLGPGVSQTFGNCQNIKSIAYISTGASTSLLVSGLSA